LRRLGQVRRISSIDIGPNQKDQGEAHPIFYLEGRTISQAKCMRRLLGLLAFDLQIHQKLHQPKAKLLLYLILATGIQKTCDMRDAQLDQIVLHRYFHSGNVIFVGLSRKSMQSFV
jgi:hypothetical protein